MKNAIEIVEKRIVNLQGVRNRCMKKKEDNLRRVETLNAILVELEKILEQLKR